MNNKFRYDLRYSFDPNNFDQQQEKNLLDFIVNGTIDGITFFLNQEELNQGHVTPEQADQWLIIIKKLMPKLRRLGVKVSLNPWTTLLHSDRGAKISQKLGFSPMVNYDGTLAVAIACPADLIWQNYIAQIYKHYATILPDYLWLEDDFRHFSHSPYISWGCFCDHHMELYSKKLGYQIKREEFVKRLLQAGKPTPERQVYLTVAGEEMVKVAKKIAKQVHAISPKTRMGLMCSFPEMHAVEGRDWTRLIEALSDQVGVAIRPHLPAYEEVAGVIYSRKFNQYSRTTVSLVPKGTFVFPELENYMYSPYAKSKRFSQFQIESSILLNPQGILLNLYDMIGSGVVPDFEYASMLKESRDLMEFLTAHQITKRYGIKVLFNPRETYYRNNYQSGKFEGLYPLAAQTLALIATFGLPVDPVAFDNQKFTDQIILISGQVLRGSSKEFITDLLLNNFVILDGEAIQVIIDAGLKQLLNIKQSHWHEARTNYQSFEEYRIPLNQISNPRVSMLQHIGDYLQIDYQNSESVEILSDAYNTKSQKLGPVMSLVNQRSLLLPLSVDPKYGWGSQYTSFKATALKRIFSQNKDLPYVIQMPTVNFTYGESSFDQKIHYLLVNFSLDKYLKIRLHLPSYNAKSLKFQATYRDGGRLVSLSVIALRKENFYEISLNLPGLSLLDLVPLNEEN